MKKDQFSVDQIIAWPNGEPSHQLSFQAVNVFGVPISFQPSLEEIHCEVSEGLQSAVLFIWYDFVKSHVIANIKIIFS
jgi:hypothetical protein